MAARRRVGGAAPSVLRPDERDEFILTFSGPNRKKIEIELRDFRILRESDPVVPGKH